MTTRSAMDLHKELAEIGQLITSVAFMAEVRSQVSKVRKGGFIVTDGKRAGQDGYEVVVKCSGASDDVCRRIKSSLPEADIKRITDDILGVNASRRGR
jgi:hypothetical protein